MEDIIRVSSLTKDYGNGKGIFGLDFSVKKGEVVGLVGTNGSGKTTTLRHMMGFIHSDSGSVSIAGLDCEKNADKIMKMVGYVPGEIDFPDVGKGTDFLKLQADFLGLRDRSSIGRLADIFKIDLTAPLRRMSKGMKQKTALVAAFMAQPDILLLDEPSTGLDPMMRDALIGLILEQKAEGRTVFLSSHVFKELEAVCDRVIFIHNGKTTDTVSCKNIGCGKADEYRIGFAEKKQFEEFLDRGFPLVKANPRYLHCNVSVEQQEMSRLFSELSPYMIRYINAVPCTLEWYYNNIVVPKEKI